MEKHKIIVGTEEGITHEHRAKQIKVDIAEEVKEREEAKKSPHKEWLQWNIEYSKEEDQLMSESPIAYRIFKFLTQNMDNYNAIMCSYVVLQEKFQRSAVSIYRAIRLLKEKKFIVILKSGASNIYAVNHNIVWRSWGTNMQYSKFPVNVILTLSEQEEMVKLHITKQKAIELKEKD